MLPSVLAPFGPNSDLAEDPAHGNVNLARANGKESARLVPPIVSTEWTLLRPTMRVKEQRRLSVPEHEDCRVLKGNCARKLKNMLSEHNNSLQNLMSRPTKHRQAGTLPLYLNSLSCTKSCLVVHMNSWTWPKIRTRKRESGDEWKGVRKAAYLGSSCQPNG